MIKAYQRVDLLILDEWLLKPLSTDQAMELFEVIEVCTRKGYMIFCTQFDPRGWYDRIKHNSLEVLIDGKVSMREHHGLKSSKAEA